MLRSLMFTYPSVIALTPKQTIASYNADDYVISTELCVVIVFTFIY